MFIIFSTGGKYVHNYFKSQRSCHVHFTRTRSSLSPTFEIAAPILGPFINILAAITMKEVRQDFFRLLIAITVATFAALLWYPLSNKLITYISDHLPPIPVPQNNVQNLTRPIIFRKKVKKISCRSSYIAC